MGALTKLDAVNRMLRASGEQAVSTLSTTSGDALLAEQILDEVILETQITGQIANTFEMRLTPDINGEIAVSDNVLHVDTMDEHANTHIVPSGNNPTLLYWKMEGTTIKNTTDFSSLGLTNGLHVRMVLKQEFLDLPIAIQFQMTDESARRYQMLTMGDTTSDQMLRQRSQQSRAIARADDIRQRDVSVFRFASGLPSRIASWSNRSWRGGR
jgi:hypothetical protein